MIEEFFDSESKDEAFYSVQYDTDGSYDVILREFDGDNSFNINIIKENTSHDG